MLHYLLIEREGDVYNKLLNKLHHHSLSQLMVELLSLKLSTNKQTENFSLDWDKEGGDSEEEKTANGTQEQELSEQEKKMTTVLNQKKQEVIQTLVKWLSRSNQDFEYALNAYTILLELAENDTTYATIIEN